MAAVNYSTDMDLADQAPARCRAFAHRPLDDGGYVMVVLLISMAVTAVWMAAAIPSWRQQVIREREAELVFRGEAYARAIYLYRQKNGGNLPPNIDTLVSQRFLRKKYLDPITGKDFLVVGGVNASGGRGVGVPAAPPGAIGAATNGTAGIIGVRSTSNDTSILIYNNQTTYSQWAFDFTVEQLKSGGGVLLNGGGTLPGVSGGRGRGGAGGEVNPIQPGQGTGRFGGRGPGSGFGPDGSGRSGVPPPQGGIQSGGRFGR